MITFHQLSQSIIVQQIARIPLLQGQLFSAIPLVGNSIKRLLYNLNAQKAYDPKGTSARFLNAAFEHIAPAQALILYLMHLFTKRKLSIDWKMVLLYYYACTR